MSILIKDVDMPQENELIIISSNGDVEKVKCDSTSCLCDSKAIELPPHGRLIDTNTFRGDKRTVCSECLLETGTCYEENYCPNCGAKMDLDGGTE